MESILTYRQAKAYREKLKYLLLSQVPLGSPEFVKELEELFTELEMADPEGLANSVVYLLKRRWKDHE